MNADPNQADRSMSFLSFASVCSTAVLGLISTSFCFGLLIVNVRLGYFGLFSSELLRVDYILVGTSFVVFVALGHVWLAYARVSARKASSEWKAGKRWSAVAVAIVRFLFLLLIPFPILYYSTDGGLDPASWKYWLAVSMMVMWAYWTAQVLRRVRFVLGAVLKDGRMLESDAANGGLSIVNLSALALIILIGYAHIVYPHVLAAFGGGQLGHVRVVLTSEGVDIARALKLEIQPGTATVVPLRLLRLNDQQVVVLVDEPSDSMAPLNQPDRAHAVYLDRRYVAAIVAVPWRKFRS